MMVREGGRTIWMNTKCHPSTAGITKAAPDGQLEDNHFLGVRGKHHQAGAGPFAPTTTPPPIKEFHRLFKIDCEFFFPALDDWRIRLRFKVADVGVSVS